MVILNGNNHSRLTTGVTMKLFFGLMSLVMSFASVASSGETKTFFYDGSRPSVELILRGEKTHTEYRYETRPGTCFRTEIVGYRTICTGGPGPGPRPGPRPYPGGGNCWREPIYRQVAYSCPQTVQIPYEVKDYDVEARLIIDVTKMSDVAANETFTATLNGDDLSITVKGSKKFLVVQKRRDIRSNMNGSVKFIDGLLAVDMIEAAPVLNTLKMSKIAFKNDTLNYNLGPIAGRASFGYSLKAVKNRRVGSDIVLFDRELNPSEIDLGASSDATVASINVDKLGIEMNDAKVTFTAKAFFKTEGALLNQAQFAEELETTRSLVVNNRN
jgi:hypothetical protein